MLWMGGGVWDMSIADLISQRKRRGPRNSTTAVYDDDTQSPVAPLRSHDIMTSDEPPAGHPFPDLWKGPLDDVKSAGGGGGVTCLIEIIETEEMEERDFSCYPDIQNESILSADIDTNNEKIYSPDSHFTRSLEAKESCARFWSDPSICPTELISEEEKHRMKKHSISCHRIGCKVCGEYAFKMRSDDELGRMLAYARSEVKKLDSGVKKYPKFSHLVASPAESVWKVRPDEPEKESYKRMRKYAACLLKKSGSNAFFMLYHPRRVLGAWKTRFAQLSYAEKGGGGIWTWLLREGKREEASFYSPHFHYISVGWLIPGGDIHYSAEGRWIVKKISLNIGGADVWWVDITTDDGMGRLKRLLTYLGTHAGIYVDEDGHQKMTCMQNYAGFRRVHVGTHVEHSMKFGQAVIRIRPNIEKRAVRAVCGVCGLDLLFAYDYDTEIDVAGREVVTAVRSLHDADDHMSRDYDYAMFTQYVIGDKSIWVCRFFDNITLMSPSEWDHEMHLHAVYEDVLDDAKTLDDYV